MSNPYDPNNPYGQSGGNEGSSGGYGQSNPYGGPIPSGGGGGYGDPYGQSNPYGNEMPKKTDAVSIIGFVLSLTCCLSLIGAILGFVGLSRTKGGRRKGRWAAISAAIIGVIGTLVGAALVAVFVIFAQSVIDVEEAKVGECASVSSDDGNSVLLREKDCSEDHDAEIVWVGDVGDVKSLDVAPTNPDDFTDSGASFLICTNLMDPADLEAIGDDVEYQYVTTDENPSDSDAALCYAERDNGDEFTEKRLP